MLTPYQYASNTPIYAIDLDGLEAVPYEEKMVHHDDDEWYETVGKYAANTLISAGNGIAGGLNLLIDPEQGLEDIGDGLVYAYNSISRDVQNPSAMWERGQRNFSDVGKWEDFTAEVATMFFGAKKLPKAKPALKNTTPKPLGAAAKKGAKIPLENSGPWPWKKVKASVSDLTKGGGNCKMCASKIKEAIGGDIIRIKDKFGAPGIGPVYTREGKLISSEFVEHYAVRKRDTIYDRITGPDGMNVNDYQNLFEYGEYLDFSNVIE